MAVANFLRAMPMCFTQFDDLLDPTGMMSWQDLCAGMQFLVLFHSFTMPLSPLIAIGIVSCGFVVLNRGCMLCHLIVKVGDMQRNRRIP